MAEARPRLAVLASGTGTILAAMIESDLPVALVVTDRCCGAEEVARSAGIEVSRLERRDFSPSFDRQRYTDELAAVLREHAIDTIAMAGFGTVLAGSFFEAFPGRVLNTHPSLLPRHKGWHAVRSALDAGDRETGCTVHIVTEELDAGPILAQERVAVREGDDEATLHERIKSVERRLYPETVRRFLACQSVSAAPAGRSGR